MPGGTPPLSFPDLCTGYDPAHRGRLVPVPVSDAFDVPRFPPRSPPPTWAAPASRRLRRRAPAHPFPGDPAPMGEPPRITNKTDLTTCLPFERPVFELERKLDELKR